MKLLFIARHATYFRNYDTVLQELARATGVRGDVQQRLHAQLLGAKLLHTCTAESGPKVSLSETSA